MHRQPAKYGGDGRKNDCLQTKGTFCQRRQSKKKLDAGEELEEGLLEVVEEALDTTDQLSEDAVIKLDKLATEKEETKALISARPKMAFEVFTSDFSQFTNFCSNQETIYEMFYDASAPDKGASQQLFQLSKILAPDLAQSVLSYSGSENSAKRRQTGWL